MRPGKNLWQIIHLMEILMRNVISLPPTPKDWLLALHPHPPQRNHHAITTRSRNQTTPWPGNQRKGDGHQVQEHSDQCGGEEHENKHIIFWPGFQEPRAHHVSQTGWKASYQDSLSLQTWTQVLRHLRAISPASKQYILLSDNVRKAKWGWGNIPN